MSGWRDESFDGAHLAEFEIALIQQFVVRKVEQLKELIGEGFSHPVADGSGIAVRAAQRLRDNFVDDAEAHQVLGGDFQGCRRIGNLGWVVPENRGASFRGNH